MKLLATAATKNHGGTETLRKTKSKTNPSTRRRQRPRRRFGSIGSSLCAKISTASNMDRTSSFLIRTNVGNLRGLPRFSSGSSLLRTGATTNPAPSVASATSVCSRFAFDFVPSVPPWLCGEYSFGCGIRVPTMLVPNRSYQDGEALETQRSPWPPPPPCAPVLHLTLFPQCPRGSVVDILLAELCCFCKSMRHGVNHVIDADANA